MINQRLIAQLQSKIALYFPDTCTINSQDFSTGQPVALYTNVPCRVQPFKSGVQPNTSEINQYAATYTLTVLYSQDLKLEYQIVHNGDTYSIQAVVDDRTPQLFKQAYMTRLTV